MRYINLIPYSYMLTSAKFQPGDSWYNSFIKLCKALHDNIERTGNKIEFKDVIDVNGIPYITTHLPITDTQERWIQTFISYSVNKNNIGLAASYSLSEILKICGYQKYTTKTKSFYFKVVAYSLMTIELNKDHMLCTQWFMTSGSNTPLIWSAKKLSYQSKYTLSDFCSLEAQTGHDLLAFDNHYPKQLDELIPVTFNWDEIL